MEVLENFIFHAFVVPTRQRRLDPKVAEIRDAVPPRKRKKNQTPSDIN
jgi:hypothetical protein